MPLGSPYEVGRENFACGFCETAENSEAFGAIKVLAKDLSKNWQRGVELLTESGSIPPCHAYHFFPPRTDIAALSNISRASDVPPSDSQRLT
jgi:hypothetical protein